MKKERILKNAERCFTVYRIAWTYTNRASEFTWSNYLNIAHMVQCQYQNFTWNMSQKIAAGIYRNLKAGIFPESPTLVRPNGLYVWTNYFGVKFPQYVKAW